MGERVVGLEGQLKRWVVVSSDKEQWGQDGEVYFSGVEGRNLHRDGECVPKLWIQIRWM